MKKLYYILLGVLVIPMVYSCKKESIDLFDQKETGNSLYFEAPFYDTDTLRKVTFGFKEKGFLDSIVAVSVATTGAPADVDREFMLELGSKTNMVKGVHYDFVSPVNTIPAGKVRTSVLIKLHRTADMQDKAVNLYLNLVANQNFNVQVKNRITINKDTLSLIKYRIMSDDILGAPYVWSVAPYKARFEDYMGTFSKVKLQLIVKLFDVDPKYFANPNYATSDYFTLPLLTYWSGYMKLWLDREALAGRQQLDENGKVITLGRYAR